MLLRAQQVDQIRFLNSKINALYDKIFKFSQKGSQIMEGDKNKEEAKEEVKEVSPLEYKPTPKVKKPDWKTETSLNELKKMTLLLCKSKRY